MLFTLSLVKAVLCPTLVKLFGKRLEEHRVEAEKLSTGIKTRATQKSSQFVVHKSAISDHVVDNNHLIDWDEARIIDKDCDRYKRWIKEAIAIRKQGTTMNRAEGQYHLSHEFDDLLKKSSATLLLGKSQHQLYTEDRHSTISVDNDDC